MPESQCRAASRTCRAARSRRARRAPCLEADDALATARHTHFYGLGGVVAQTLSTARDTQHQTHTRTEHTRGSGRAWADLFAYLSITGSQRATHNTADAHTNGTHRTEHRAGHLATNGPTNNARLGATFGDGLRPGTQLRLSAVGQSAVHRVSLCCLYYMFRHSAGPSCTLATLVLPPRRWPADERMTRCSTAADTTRAAFKPGRSKAL